MNDDELPGLHERALAATRAIVAGVRPDQWSASTPCAEWSVRELTNHVVTGNWWADELASGKSIADVGDRLDGDVLGSDPLAAYDASAAAAAAAFNRSGAMDAPCAVSYGPVPGSVYCGHRYIDVLIHGWDLAKATGQNTTIDPHLASACLEIVRPQAALLEGSGMFGEPTPAAGSSDEAVLLAMLGRRA